MDLTAANPYQIDKELADLHDTFSHIATLLRAAYDRGHRLLGEQRETDHQGRRNRGPWPTGDTNMIERLHGLSFDQHDFRETTRIQVVGHIALHREQIDNLRHQIDILDAEFDQRGGWSRFFTVEDGHIHSGLRCKGGTIRPSTRLGWNPELSGKTEADAVAKLGPSLCTHCFPSAPIEWKVGNEPKRPRCEGSGQQEKPGTYRRLGSGGYGVCRVCGTRQTVTGRGYIRAHKPADQ